MSPRVWLPPEPGVLKVNIDVVAFAESRIGIDIIVCNHLDIPLLAKAMTREGKFSIEYGELLGAIESYVVGSSLCPV